ncbi:polysaccharide biosynthesis protein [Fictibacillus nanhaiensis]|uniref:putative polysaccharide biosynthesis protein n=1 Tax=Fictibacillus nanhaiensis TaxID=742169 RepID=UPI001C9857D1|nr:polysaccharide biosynthesis protein [Fictibacillus nanhaiensis]MBY6035122.1 polysaccharide biosynthesis protein [Fictibacillus nanhaiensis]
MSRLLRGTLILTAATFFSKFIGLIYVIPFTNLVDEEGMALYGYAYIPYTILLSISTMGVPLAVSKFVSKYNALGDYATGRRLLRSGLLIMTITGFLAFLLLYNLAPILAHSIIGKYGGKGNSISDITFVIRMVSTALIIVPSMSLIRGYFQGYQSMGPTAVSQVIEQIVRIVFILVGSYIIVEILNGSITTAVGLATFAATLGAVAGFIVLLWYWRKRKPHLQKLYDNSKPASDISLMEIYKETIKYAIPFVAVGLAIPLYQLIDQFTIVKTLKTIEYTQKEAESVYAIITQIAHKIVMIPVSLATALALTLIPVITKSFTQNNGELLHKQITQTFQIVLFLTAPAAIGLTVLAYPAYGALFGIDNMKTGGYYLQWYAPTGLWFAMFTVTAAILQGLNQQRFAFISLGLGFLAKFLLNKPLLLGFGGTGSVIATNIGYTLSILFNLYIIKKYSGFSFKWVYRRTVLMTVFIAIMGIAVAVVTMLLGDTETRMGSIMKLAIGIVTGGAVYAYLSYRSGLLKIILGDRIPFLRGKN